MVINGHLVWFGAALASQSGAFEQKWTQGPDECPGWNENSQHMLKPNLTNPHQWSIWFGLERLWPPKVEPWSRNVPKAPGWNEIFWSSLNQTSLTPRVPTFFLPLSPVKVLTNID